MAVDTHARTGRGMALRESMHRGRVLVDLIESDDEDREDSEEDYGYAADNIVEYFGDYAEDEEAITRAAAAAVAAAAPTKKHPLLKHRIDPAYRGMYDRMPKADVFVVIEADMAVASNYSAPIQLGLIAARDFAPGEVVTFYGGLPLPQSAIRSAKQIDHPMSHAAVIKGVDDALDGLPFAMMIRRPVPGSDEVLRRLIYNGVEDLMPRLSDGLYTAEEIRAFERSPFGYLCNSPGPGQKANIKMAYRKLNKLGLREVPWLVASVPIRKYDTLLWNYNNNEVFGPVPVASLSRSASDESNASARTYGSAAAIPSLPLHQQHRQQHRQAEQGALLDLSLHMSRIAVRNNNDAKQSARPRREINLR